MSQKNKLSQEMFEEYLADRFRQAQGVKGWDVDYVKKSPNPSSNDQFSVNAIAFYLPQFHPIPENDKWWGAGFTEWTNVTKAVPQFMGHYQPHLPGELGFYDLRLVDNIRKQADLANHYGIYGFCFHHYWFNGKKLLNGPVESLLNNKDINLKYCLSWANENWSRRWDGLDQEILIAQGHSPEDDIAFFDSLLPFFLDDRYIRINDLPVLLVYRLSLLPDPRATVDRWRRRARYHGLKGVYLIGVQSFDIKNPTIFGFDAGVEFPPHQISAKTITGEQRIVNPEFSGEVYDYREVAKRFGKVEYDYPCYKCVIPSWDNEPRKPGRGLAFHGSSPLLYAEWLRDACVSTIQNDYLNEKFIFINAWNEWAEGAHLEPDRRYGYAFLHSTMSTLKLFSRCDELQSLVDSHNLEFVKKSKYAIVLHLFYTDLWESLLPLLRNVSGADIFISIVNETEPEVIRRIVASGLNVYFVIVENKGRDIAPFLKCSERVFASGYLYACKIHTKRSLHRVDGDSWRNQILNALLGRIDVLDEVSALFDANPALGILAPEASLVNLGVPEIHLGNVNWLNIVLKDIGCERFIGNYEFEFVAGSMFWFRTEALSRLSDLVNYEKNFEMEAGQLDGTLAHCFERLFLLLASENGFVCQQVNFCKSNLGLEHGNEQ